MATVEPTGELADGSEWLHSVNVNKVFKLLGGLDSQLMSIRGFASCSKSMNDTQLSSLDV